MSQQPTTLQDAVAAAIRDLHNQVVRNWRLTGEEVQAEISFSSHAEVLERTLTNQGFNCTITKNMGSLEEPYVIRFHSVPNGFVEQTLRTAQNPVGREADEVIGSLREAIKHDWKFQHQILATKVDNASQATALEAELTRRGFGCSVYKDMGSLEEPFLVQFHYLPDKFEQEALC